MTIKEGNSGAKLAKFVVQLDDPMIASAIINFTTADSTATVANNDYALTAGTAIFEPGTIIDTVSIPVYGDVVAEPNELFKVMLSNPVNITIANGTALGRITNDDAAAIQSVSDAQMSSKIVIPNSIGRTQLWTIQGVASKRVNAAIADAQGNLVWNETNYQNNKSFSGFKPGNYFYRVEVFTGGNQHEVYTGMLLLNE